MATEADLWDSPEKRNCKSAPLVLRSEPVVLLLESVLANSEIAMTKHIFVTGGVVSSIGKGLTSASIGMLLEARGLRVRMQKLDPYINVDPGTMSPY